MSTIQWTGGGPLLNSAWNASIAFTASPQFVLSWQTNDAQANPATAVATGKVVGSSNQSVQLDPSSASLPGTNGKVAGSGSVVVGAYTSDVQGTPPSNWTALGQADGSSVNFSPGQILLPGGPPSVAVNAGGKAVEVQCQKEGLTPGPLVATPGGLGSHGIGWGDTMPFDTGIAPTVALNDSSTVVSVHASILGAGGKLYYNIGSLQNGALVWSGGGKYDTGVYPCVALNDQGWVVEVHNAPSAEHLYCWLGQVSQDGKSVNWLTATHFDDGYYASVALDQQGNIVSVHQSNSIGGALYYNVGKIVP